MNGRVLSIDPGHKRLGVALSDPTATLAAPLTVIKHVSLVRDCEEIVILATNWEVTLILVGQALGGEGEETPQARHSKKIANLLRELTAIDIALWDESGTTRIARQTKIDMGVNRKKRSGHLDESAAAVILQSYLDDHNKVVF